MNDMNKLKYELSRLVNAKDYKQLIHYYVLIQKHDRLVPQNLNEETPCADMHLLKHKSAIKFESRHCHRVYFVTPLFDMNNTK